MRWYSSQGLLEGSISEKGESHSIQNVSKRVQRESRPQKSQRKGIRNEMNSDDEGKERNVNRINVEHEGNNDRRGEMNRKV